MHTWSWVICHMLQSIIHRQLPWVQGLTLDSCLDAVSMHARSCHTRRRLHNVESII
jgi:hypothetical protein